MAGQSPRQLRAWTKITNGGARAVKLAFGACALQIRLWRSADRAGTPVWRSEYRQPVHVPGARPTSYGCPDMLITHKLPPADTLPFRVAIPLGEVLNDSLPYGDYWVSVELRLLDDSLRPPAWETKYDFPAGRVTIRRESDAPPSVRIQAQLRIEAATRLVRGGSRETDSVRTFVLVTNTSSDSSEVVVVRGNPLTVYAFRSAAERDSLPIPTPVYTMRGAGYFIPQRFMLGPGKKWLFENSAAVRDMMAGVGAGQYDFLAWLVGEPSFMLSAGEVTIRR